MNLGELVLYLFISINAVFFIAMIVFILLVAPIYIVYTSAQPVIKKKKILKELDAEIESLKHKINEK